MLAATTRTVKSPEAPAGAHTASTLLSGSALRATFPQKRCPDKSFPLVTASQDRPPVFAAEFPRVVTQVCSEGLLGWLVTFRLDQSGVESVGSIDSNADAIERAPQDQSPALVS